MQRYLITKQDYKGNILGLWNFTDSNQAWAIYNSLRGYYDDKIILSTETENGRCAVISVK
jgi:hypothetical protein